MPKAVRMPKLEEVPIRAPEPRHGSRHDHVGWFLRGFAAAALLFGGYLVYQDFFGGAVASHDEPRTIIVGK